MYEDFKAENENLLKSVRGLVKFNGGFFKSAKQAAFLKRSLGYFAIPAEASYPEKAGVKFFSSSSKKSSVEQFFSFADYGVRSKREVPYVIEYDDKGIIGFWKLSRGYSEDGHSSWIKEGKNELLFSRESEAGFDLSWYEEELKAKAAAPVSQWQGSIGNPILIKNATVLNVSSFASQFGVGLVVSLEDEAKNVYSWFTSPSKKINFSELKGKVVNLKGKVKDHTVFRDKKQTVLTRCSIV